MEIRGTLCPVETLGTLYPVGLHKDTLYPVEAGTQSTPHSQQDIHAPWDCIKTQSRGDCIKQARGALAGNIVSQGLYVLEL